MTQFRFLRPTSWLAKRLGLSVSTIERLRAQGSNDLPPCVRIGGAIRYDDVTVERLCCTNRVHRLLGDRFVTNEPEDAEAASEAVPYKELEGV